MNTDQNNRVKID